MEWLIAVKSAQVHPFTDRNGKPVDHGGGKKQLPDSARRGTCGNDPPDHVRRAAKKPSIAERNIPGNCPFKAAEKGETIFIGIPIEQRIVVNRFDHDRRQGGAGKDKR